MKYVSVFYEGEHNDARTNLCIAFTAAMHGAAIANYAKVERILFDEKGVACGAEVVDKANPSAKSFEIKAKKIVYCGGPFTDGLRQLSEGKDVKPMVNASGGGLEDTSLCNPAPELQRTKEHTSFFRLIIVRGTLEWWT
eukprot:g1998.t1